MGRLGGGVLDVPWVFEVFGGILGVKAPKKISKPLTPKYVLNCLYDILEKKLITGVGVDPRELRRAIKRLRSCRACGLSKAIRKSYRKRTVRPRATMEFERVFVDLCGPITPTTRSGKKYYMVVVDDYTDYKQMPPKCSEYCL